MKPRKARDYIINGSSQEPRGAKISCAKLDYLISGQATVVASGKANTWTRLVQFRRGGAYGLLLKPLNFPR